MRDETNDWLDPMLDEALKRDIDVTASMRQASMPVAETDRPDLERINDMVAGGRCGPGATARGPRD